METTKSLSENSKKIITRRPDGSRRVQTINEDVSLTDQQWKEDVNINTIMDRFQKTGRINHTSGKQGVYADVSQIPDLLTASNIVKDASEKFASLNSKIRERFSNDPLKMVSFLQDPQNYDEAVNLGMLTKKEMKNDDSNDEKSQKKEAKIPKKTEPSE